jgi:glycosyltransferase involved in cell wall biosynthesis
MHIHLWLSHLFCKRLFAATAQSMPMYAADSKRVITGHGVQVDFWDAEGNASVQKRAATELVSVHRLCRSKRLDIVINALALLPSPYTLTVYGRDVEKDYVLELHELIALKKLENRVTFKGPVPMAALRQIYPQYGSMVNMAFETIDKTMLEGMVCGVYPVTTKRNAEAIGLPYAPLDDTPQAVANFIAHMHEHTLPPAELKRIVVEHHSLSALVKKMTEYVRKGV